jgi:DNA-binding GntR family transcriptional regulator
MKVIHSKNDNYNNGFNEENLNQQLRDKEKILKSMEVTMNKALAENLELKKISTGRTN